MTNNLSTAWINLAPLETPQELEDFTRLDKMVNTMVDDIIYNEGGCFLVTGYPGVGKTSFVNKVLYRARNEFPQEKHLVTVRLSLARDYSTDKLLRRMIRELFHALNQVKNYGLMINGLVVDKKVRLYDELYPVVQNYLDLAYLRTSQQIKSVLSQGLKDAIVHHESATQAKTAETRLSPSIGVDKLSASLGSFSKTKSTSITREETRSQEVSWERGVELEFLEYDDEIAENDLCRLLDLLVQKGVRYTLSTYSSPFKFPGWFWRRLPEEFSLFGRTIHNYKLRREPEDSVGNQPVRVVFVFDEIDKISLEQAESIFSSLKNLFLKGNVFFILITGKAFYYDWLRQRAAEDEIFYSLFTRILHIPLLRDVELEKMLGSMQLTLPADLLTHLKYRAKGAPREFFRELCGFTHWRKFRNGHLRLPVMHLSEDSQRLVDISSRLYPILKQAYDEKVEACRPQIDPGVKDYLRRSLHNWLEWMTLLLTFTKEDILFPTVEEQKRGVKLLFAPRARELFDGLFEDLLQEGILIPTGKEKDGAPLYTFADDMKKRIQAVEFSALTRDEAWIEANQRQSRQKDPGDAAAGGENIPKQVEIERLLAEAVARLEDGNFERAADCLERVLRLDPQNREALWLGRALEDCRTLSDIHHTALTDLRVGLFDEARQALARILNRYSETMNHTVQKFLSRLKHTYLQVIRILELKNQAETDLASGAWASAGQALGALQEIAFNLDMHWDFLDTLIVRYGEQTAMATAPQDQKATESGAKMLPDGSAGAQNQSPASDPKLIPAQTGS